MSAELSSLLDQLAIRMWEPPLIDRWRARSVSPPAMTVLLVLAFETDVEMDGLFGFLENSSGEFLPEVANAFDAIGAKDSARLLEEVVMVMKEHGVTHAGEGTPLLEKELERLEEQLYLNDPDPEPVRGMLEAYASKYREELLALLAEA